MLILNACFLMGLGKSDSQCFTVWPSCIVAPIQGIIFVFDSKIGKNK